jgi:hypothetical protein
MTGQKKPAIYEAKRALSCLSCFILSEDQTRKREGEERDKSAIGAVMGF